MNLITEILKISLGNVLLFECLDSNFLSTAFATINLAKGTFTNEFVKFNLFAFNLRSGILKEMEQERKKEEKKEEKKENELGLFEKAKKNVRHTSDREDVDALAMMKEGVILQIEQGENQDKKKLFGALPFKNCCERKPNSISHPWGSVHV